MSDVYLREHPPARSQYRSPRRARPTGLTVVHTAESIMDTVGPDTGAENVAAFIRRRSEPGSYHDLVDSDSSIQLVRYADEAFQDGTGSNPYALSISFALKATDWPRLSPARRDAFLEQAAVAFHRQQAWLRAHDYPLTPLRRIGPAASELGHAGFITHAERDPDRRKDPGAGFPWLRFLQILTPPPAPAPPPQPSAVKEAPSMILILDPNDHHLYLCDRTGASKIDGPERDELLATKAVPMIGKGRPKDARRDMLIRRGVQL
jgi:hypothetical protein